MYSIRSCSLIWNWLDCMRGSVGKEKVWKFGVFPKAWYICAAIHLKNRNDTEEVQYFPTHYTILLRWCVNAWKLQGKIVANGQRCVHEAGSRKSKSPIFLDRESRFLCLRMSTIDMRTNRDQKCWGQLHACMCASATEFQNENVIEEVFHRQNENFLRRIVVFWFPKFDRAYLNHFFFEETYLNHSPNHILFFAYTFFLLAMKPICMQMCSAWKAEMNVQTDAGRCTHMYRLISRQHCRS